ncbi:MAG: glycosyltransferase [Candidatus Sedimenticola endophacoides]
MKQTFNKYFSKIKQPISAREIEKHYLDEKAQITRIKKHICDREANYELTPWNSRPRIFIAVRTVNWEKSGLVDSWRDVADVVHYDWENAYDQNSKDWFERGRVEFSNRLYQSVALENEKKPIHVFFSYLSGRWVDRWVIERIRSLGIITINYDFDDSKKFWNSKIRGVYTGSAEIASAYDVCVSAQSGKNIGKYIAIGANPIFLPSGVNESKFGVERNPIIRDLFVSFVGQNYGRRSKMISYIKKNGIDVYTRGINWPHGSVGEDEMVAIYHRSVISLGFGYIGKSRMVGLKGRDFEVPACGCAYMTTYNSELEKYFVPEKEIVFYSGEKELMEKLRYYSANQKEAKEIGDRGRERVLREHTWSARWRYLLSVIKSSA